MSTQVLRVGILSASRTIEKTFLPTLMSLQTLFKLTIIYHQDEEVARSIQSNFNIPESTTSAHELLKHSAVDLVFNFLPFEFHEHYTILALKEGKHVMVETPVGINVPTLGNLRAAMEQGSTPTRKPRLFISCARRYAPCYTDLFITELATLEHIQYARCRNISGPLEVHAIPYFAPAPPESASWANGLSDRLQAHGRLYSAAPTPYSQFHTVLTHTFRSDDITPARVALCRFLGTLGCHDLSVLRETLGFPDAVTNFALTHPFYNTVFHYEGDGHPFTVLYEAGVDTLPRCDISLTVYGGKKTVSVQYDFACIGGETEGGFGVRVVVEELDESGGGGGAPRIKRTEAVSSVAEAYEKELRAMHAYFATDEPQEGAKTTGEDALFDLRVMNLIIGHYNRQHGTIRTPLG